MKISKVQMSASPHSSQSTILRSFETWEGPETALLKFSFQGCLEGSPGLGRPMINQHHQLHVDPVACHA